MKKLVRDKRGRNDIRTGLGIDVPESFLATLDWKTKGMPKAYSPHFEVSNLGQKVNIIAGRRIGDVQRADTLATQGFNIQGFGGQIHEVPTKDLTSWNSVKKKKINSDIYTYNAFTPTHSDDYLTAAKKFGARNLKRLPKIGEGRDRIVYALDQDKVLKVAKNPKGLEQNERERDLEYLEGLKHYESGKDFVVMERAQKPGRSTTTMLRGLRKAGMKPWEEDPGKLSEIFEKAGVSQEYLNYNLSSGDFLAKRNWGEKDGVPVLIDAGTLSRESTRPSKIKAGPFGRGYSQDPEWREIQQERRAFKTSGKVYPHEEDKYANKPMTPYPEATHALRDWPIADATSKDSTFVLAKEQDMPYNVKTKRTFMYTVGYDPNKIFIAKGLQNIDTDKEHNVEAIARMTGHEELHNLLQKTQGDEASHKLDNISIGTIRVGDRDILYPKGANIYPPSIALAKRKEIRGAMLGREIAPIINDTDGKNKLWHTAVNKKEWPLHHLSDQRRTELVNQMLYGDDISQNMPIRQEPTELTYTEGIDPSIVPILKRLNRQGLKTCASCSGISSEHKGESSPYLSVELPEDVASSGGRDIFDVDKIHKPKEVKRYQEAGKRAGWTTEVTKFMMHQPTIRYGMPFGGTIKIEKQVKSNPRYIEAQNAIKVGDKDFQHFLKTVDERNAIEEELYKEYQGKDWTDEKRKAQWEKLEHELVAESERPAPVEKQKITYPKSGGD